MKDNKTEIKIGHPCKVWAAEYNLTARQMAAAIGISTVSYSRLVNGEVDPSASTITKIEIATNMEITWNSIVEWAKKNKLFSYSKKTKVG